MFWACPDPIDLLGAMHESCVSAGISLSLAKKSTDERTASDVIVMILKTFESSDK